MLGKRWLAIRSIAMTILFPGTVAFYIPYRILAPVDMPGPSGWSFGQYGAILVVGVGLAILLRCVWEFAHLGRGTLAPFDEPRKLVIRGLYRYVRNPMYVGVVLILVGESWFFWTSALLMYTGLFFVLANLFVIGYEEHRLRAKFGDEYEQYRRDVGRWIARLRLQ